MEISNEIKRKVFATYIGQMAKISRRYDSGIPDYYEDGKIVPLDGFIIDWQHEFTECKLILKPFSSITDEHATEIAKMMGYSFKEIVRTKERIYLADSFSKTKMLYPTSHHIDILFNAHRIQYDEGTGQDSYDFDSDYFVYQFLVEKGYDMPHYLLDKKTLQQSGLAIYETNNNE